jgi:hypothetical protein
MSQLFGDADAQASLCCCLLVVTSQNFPNFGMRNKNKI